MIQATVNWRLTHSLIISLLLCILCGLTPTEGGRDRDTLNIGLEVPTWARAGGTVTMGCKFDVGEDPVYQVKWYKGSKEFYRYTPRESPHVKIFQFPSLHVDLVRSNATQITLTKLDLSMKGSYSCEVSTDAPDFLTALKTAHLDVVLFPESPPVISGLKSSYSVGDIVHANCTSYRSKPAANLTWSINSGQVQPDYLVPFRIKENSTETSQLTLRFQLRPGLFHHGRLTLVCSSRIHGYYHKSSETTIFEEDKPKLSSVVDNTSSGSTGNGGVKNSGSLSVWSGASSGYFYYLSMQTIFLMTTTSSQLLLFGSRLLSIC